MKHLLSIAELSRTEIEGLLDYAEALGREDSPRLLARKTVVNLFLEPSTRTRGSFETAAKRLGAEVVNLTSSGTSVVKGESLADTARTVDAFAPAAIVIRHAYAGAAHYIAARVKASVINGGDGQHEHPTQALLDALTIRRHKGRVAGLTVAIVGDIRHSRVARSDARALSKLGARVVVAGPPTLIPAGFESLGARVARSLEEAVDGADVVMALRIQQERMAEAFVPSLREYSAGWRLDEARLAGAKKDAIVMHPGPMNRGVEIDPALADGPRSVITDQVANGVLVRMAVLAELASAHAEETGDDDEIDDEDEPEPEDEPVEKKKRAGS